jgi:cellulose synthase/poly-beta-1,6-N-acetylglucosamine synthase-like glycosyltransferase
MSGSEILLLCLSAYAVLWAVCLIVPIAMATLLSRARHEIGLTVKHSPSVAVIVPAGNAERTIDGCIMALRACDYPDGKLNIYVVADHCTDSTAETARTTGAEVLSRTSGPRGKTYSIAWALDQLTNRRITPDLYLIVDATARVEENFLRALAQRWANGAQIISSHSVLNTENSAWYARCLGLMLVHRNLQCWAREKLDLSALLEGRGMAYARDYIQRFGWSLALPKSHGAHPTEDWRHAVRAAEQGYRVGYAEDARVSTPLRGSLAEATQQGARWERGRLINAATYALRLLWSGLRQRDSVKIFAALDAMQPPVAILGALSFTVAVLNYLYSTQPIALKALGYVPIGLIIAYGIIIVVRGRREGIGVATLVWAPLYVFWRCSAFVLAWAFFDRISKKPQPAGAQHCDRWLVCDLEDRKRQGYGR